MHGFKPHEGIQQFRIEENSSLVQRHAPITSIEDEPTFIEFDENSEMPSSVSYNSDDNFDGLGFRV